MTTPSLICFDLGGVIVRICRSWREGCERAGVPVRDCETPSHEMLRSLADDHQIGAIDLATFARRMSEWFDGRYSVEEIIAVHDAWVIGPYAGLETLIDRIHERGLVTAALSNTDAAHWAELPRIAAIARMRHRLASHELGLRKPDPAIYREAERRLGHRGEEILFFDDLEKNVEAARAAGWHAVQIDPMRETAPQIETALHEHDALSVR